MRRSAMAALFTVTACLPVLAADDPVYSGPQPGEKLPPFKVKGILGEMGGKEYDPVGRADGRPVALVFFHERTRPAFGLTNAVMRYAAGRSKDGLHTAVVFLTEDPTATEEWMKAVQQNLPEGVEFGVSPDGREGPGAYGLNRNVTLTVLVGNEGKVTANFALVQPGLEADGPKILKAVVDVLGGGEVPDIATLAPQMRRPASGRAETDPDLAPLVRAVIDKQATPEEVAEAAKKVEEYVADHPVARRQLGRIATTVANSGKLENYGTPAAQEKIREWARKYGENKDRE